MRVIIILISLLSAAACTKPPEETKKNTTSSSGRYLYVASGACYSGLGNTAFSNTTSSNLVYRINLETGTRDSIIADYNASPAQAGDSPIGVHSIDDNYLYVVVENTTTAGARRIEKVEKKLNGVRTAFSNNITALSGQLRSSYMFSNGDLLISKTTAVEKITSANVRITAGANPIVNAPNGTTNVCGTTNNTLAPKAIALSNGNIVFLHAAASQNRISILPAAGYNTAADCAAATTYTSLVPATSSPVAAVYDAANSKLIVAWAGNVITNNVTSIYAYTINESTRAITAAQEIYDAADYPGTYSYLLYGVSEMVLDTTTNSLYVATAISTATTVVNYAIEKFTYDASKIGTANSSVLTRVGTVPFYQYGVDTKCIAGMAVGK